MKTFLWITIVGSLLAVLTAIGAPQPLASPAVIEQTECACKDLKTLQIELRNALRLQQAMRNKIPELRTVNYPTSISRYKTFTETDARRGLEPIPGYDKLSKDDKALLQYDYVPQGFSLDDPTHPPAKLNGVTLNDATLCSLTASAATELVRMKKLMGCDGIGAAVQAHEDVHKHSCEGGFIAFFGLNGAERAQEEVDAYGVQIAVLRAEIARVLEKNCQPCNGQWQGTITYTVVRNVVSHRTKPSSTDGYTTTDGGHDNSDETETWSGMVTVDGHNGMADSSYDDILTMDEASYGTTRCCPSAAACGGSGMGRIAWSSQNSLTGYASGSGQGRVSVYIVLEKDGYKVESSTVAVNVTGEKNTQSSGKACIGNHPGSFPAKSYSQGYTGMGQNVVLAAGRGKYGPDPNKLSGSDTVKSGNTVTTLTWNLRRCN